MECNLCCRLAAYVYIIMCVYVCVRQCACLYNICMNNWNHFTTLGVNLDSRGSIELRLLCIQCTLVVLVVEDLVEGQDTTNSLPGLCTLYHNCTNAKQSRKETARSVSVTQVELLPGLKIPHLSIYLLSAVLAACKEPHTRPPFEMQLTHFACNDLAPSTGAGKS